MFYCFRVVEKAIHSAISTHIFGGENTSTSSEEGSFDYDEIFLVT